jgi:triacylglycerol esterase/lipase EstA (alpha/beta hydrolase family)
MQLVAVGHSMGALTLWQYIEEHGCEQAAQGVFSSTSRQNCSPTPNG